MGRKTKKSLKKGGTKRSLKKGNTKRARLNIPGTKEVNLDQDVIPAVEMESILGDFRVEEFTNSNTSILVTPIMSTLIGDLEDSILRNQSFKKVLQGPSGVGKTTTLLYIGHMARAKGYLVFPIQASEFVNQPEPLSRLIKEFILKWVNAVGQDILQKVTPRLYAYSSLWELVNRDMVSDEKVAMTVFSQLVDELKMCATKPVIFLVDQCNVFHSDPQVIKLYSDSEDMSVSPRKNPVGVKFLDWQTFKVICGGLFFGLSSAFQLLPTARGGNCRLERLINPMDAEQFKRFVVVLIQQNRLPPECESTHFQDLLQLCGGIPREACKFAEIVFRVASGTNPNTTNYQDWKDAYMKARINFYKSRIKQLLDDKILGPELLLESVPFASSLFIGEKMESAPDIWIASGLIVARTDAVMLCPAAEQAMLSVFDEHEAVRQAIQVLRSDRGTRWRTLELAVVYLFRKSCGHSIQFDYTALHGNNKKNLTITAEWIQHGGTTAPAPNSIPRNTLFVCTRNVPVVDFFIHDANGAQILIQASESLSRERIETYIQDGEEYSASAMDPLPDAKLKYFYLTPNGDSKDAVSKKATGRSTKKNYRDDVFLVAGTDAKRLFGDLFDERKGV